MAGDFYETIPVLDNFAEAVRAENYTPLPDDWAVGFADVVGSTQAVANGRYKAVNMVGAGVIAAVGNALKRRSFPFVFGGDGASFAVSPGDAPAAQEALAAMAAFAHEEFEFDLRVGTIPVRDARAAGRDVRVARYGATPYCVYAMFMGGGLAWFEDEVKRAVISCRRRPPARVRISLAYLADGASPRPRTASSSRSLSRRAEMTRAFRRSSTKL